MKKVAFFGLMLALCVSGQVAAQGANISFDNVAAVFRNAGYMVMGPMTLATPSGQMTMITTAYSGEGGTEEFSLQLFDNDAAARYGWYAAGNLIEIRRASGEAMAYQFAGTSLEAWFQPPQAKTRGRAGRFVWFGTPAAMTLFESARN